MVQKYLKALVFDLDGTLYTSVPLGLEILRSACRYVGALKGVTIDEADRLISDTRRKISARTGMATSLSRACEELGGNLQELHRHFAADVRPEQFLTRDERVVALLKLLAPRFDLYVYTNNNFILTTAIMARLGVGDLFHGIFTIEDSWAPKPDRETLESILRRIGKNPDECLFIGDRYDIDLRLPAEIGCAVFLVNTVEDLFPLAKLLTDTSA